MRDSKDFDKISESWESKESDAIDSEEVFIGFWKSEGASKDCNKIPKVPKIGDHKTFIRLQRFYIESRDYDDIDSVRIPKIW